MSYLWPGNRSERQSWEKKTGLASGQVYGTEGTAGPKHLFSCHGNAAGHGRDPSSGAEK